MKNFTKFLSVFTVLSVGLFLSATKAHADLISPPGIIPGTSLEEILIIGGCIIVGALVSWLVIRAIRRKKNVINK